jgi:hypothetical protein
MNIKKHVYNLIVEKSLANDFSSVVRKNIYSHLKRKTITEGLYTTENGDENLVRPDLKYYAFDWDDNLLFMPTKIIVMSENEEDVPMSTEDFAEYRHKIGVEPFNYKGTTIIGLAPNSFRNFTETGDKRFVIDCMTASVGPAWNDFVECINGGSIFSIITARGHNPETIKESVLNLIMGSKNGISKEKLEESLSKYDLLMSDNVSEEIKPIANTKIQEYLNLCKFYPVTFGSGSAASPEQGKIKSLKEFISYCKEQAKELISKILEKNPDMNLQDLVPKFKNDVNMNEPIQNLDEFIEKNIMFGFSDDDERNVDTIGDMLSKEYTNNPVSLYLTKGGEKKKVN